MRHLLSFLLLAALLVGCTSTKEAPTLPASVSANEEAGPVFDTEKRLYARLDELGVLVPDSVVVVKDTVAHGWVDHWNAPETVHLTTNRARYPDAEIPGDFPYLFGRTKMPDAKTFRAYVAAHELAHIHGPRLKAEMGRPALGVDKRTQEVQAEILALVLMHAAYGATREDLGYPASIDYPFIPEQPVATLQRQYCYIVNRTWQAELDCK